MLVGWNHWKFYSRMFEVKQLAGSVSSKCLCCLSKKKKKQPDKQFKINKNNYATFSKRASRRSRGARRVQNTVRLHSSSCWQQNNGNETSAAVANGQHTWTTVTKISAVLLKIPTHSRKRCKRKRTDKMEGKKKRAKEWMNSSGTDFADFDVLNVHLLQIRV